MRQLPNEQCLIENVISIELIATLYSPHSTSSFLGEASRSNLLKQDFKQNKQYLC